MKEVLQYFVLPSNIVLLFFLVGLSLIRVKKRKWSVIFFSVAMITYIIFATGPLSFWLLKGLEYQYPPLDSAKNYEDATTVVILAAHAENDTNISLSSRVNDAGAFRLIETVGIINKIQHPKIWITGSEEIPELMKEVLVQMGVASDQIFIENQSRDTFESALNLKDWLKGDLFFLVTSAGHMPRAMGVFKKQKLTPIPAPTHFLSRKNYLAISYLPSPLHLYYSDLAVHEYLGILWYKMTDRI